MQISVSDTDGEVFVLDVSEDLELENLKALCSFESRIPADDMSVVYDGRPLLDAKKSLKFYGIKNGDMIFIQQSRQLSRPANPSAGNRSAANPNNAAPFHFPDFSNIQVPSSSTANRIPKEHETEFPKYLKEMLMKNPHELSLLKQNNPRLADALLSGDLEKFTSVLREQQKQRAEKELHRIRVMNADPFDIEAQKLIAEEIKQQNIDQNMEHAIEHAPESFGQVVMLYIECNVHGHPVKAFVDSGAQTTIMSQQCAERCGIMRLVDTRWRGVAKGVGVQKIIGRVHLGQIQIGKDYLASSFSILEDQPMDMLLGLDMLKRHQCVIDLKQNVLVIGTTGAQTPFLHESELPECAKLNRDPQTDDMLIDGEEDEQIARALAESAKGSSPAGSSSSGSGNPSQHSFAEADISKITEMGFTRELATQGLVQSNGDPGKAVAILLAKSIAVPNKTAANKRK